MSVLLVPGFMADETLWRELQAGIPGATLELIGDTGHMIPIEAPQRLAGVIAPWLERHAGLPG